MSEASTTRPEMVVVVSTARRGAGSLAIASRAGGGGLAGGGAEGVSSWITWRGANGWSEVDNTGGAAAAGGEAGAVSWATASLGAAGAVSVRLERIYLPEKAKRSQIFDGPPKEAAAQLVEKLRHEARGV